MNWYLSVLKNYATFSGRARRKEYWMFTLFNAIFYVTLSVLDALLGLVNYDNPFGILAPIYSLAVMLPGIAVGIRRLHDTGRSAWWLAISLVPLIGIIVLMVFMCLDSQAGENKYGANPKAEGK